MAAKRARMSCVGWVAPAILALAVLGASPAAADVAGTDITAFLNAQRAAQGVPAGIVEDPALSDGCAKHNAYGLTNGVLTHGEDPALPGYTPEGDQAARTSVLYQGAGPWTAGHNPFETAPIHLHQLLAPRLDRMGASENAGYGCATTLASRARPAPVADVTYTYPGDGATAWQPSQLAAEGPYTPGELVGLPAGTTTGPYLYVMFDGPDLTVFDTATATSATLTGPDGPVDVAVVDNHTPGLDGFLPTGMQVIPRAALRPNASYTASVAASVSTQGRTGPARAFARTWSFTTGGLGNAVRITRVSKLGLDVTVSATSAAAGATVTATGPGTTASQPLGAAGSATLHLDAEGTWQVCVLSGGDGTGFAMGQDCIAVAVSQPRGAAPAAAPGTGAQHGPLAGASNRPFTVSVPRFVRHGRAIRLSITSATRFSLRIRVTTRGGRTLARLPTRTRSGRLAARSFRVRVPAPYNGRSRSVRVSLLIAVQGRRYPVRRSVRFT